MLTESIRPHKPFRLSHAELGDCVLLATGNEETKAITLCAGEVTQTRFGALRHDDCIGKQYGSKIQTSRGHVHILAFDPVLWSASVPHRTQIIYTPDASLIVGSLDLVPGSKVFESGTGSGSLTHFLAQAVWPTGRVHTFEFHENRAERAANEFLAHSLSTLVTVVHKDICVNGFPQIGEAENPDGVNAVILDVPQPWLAIPTLRNVFRRDSVGRFCSFSPCIEQVQRTCAALRQAGFVQIQTFECLQRSFSVPRAPLQVPNMGQLPESVNDKSDLHNPVPVDSEVDDNKTEEQDGDGDLGGKKAKSTQPRQQTRALFPHPNGSSFSWEAIPQPTMAGHTGYLTFASWLAKRIPTERGNSLMDID